MKVITCNVNGIRAAARKGFFTWLAAEDADFICVQETKAQMAHLADEVFYPAAYHAVFSDAEKKGYSGVGIYSKHQPDTVISSLGLPWADAEGRFIEIICGKLRIVSVYFPSGSSGEARQALKYDFMAHFQSAYLDSIMQDDTSVIMCGDFNIVHQARDIKNWRANQKNSGCLPEERAWLDACFKNGFVDAFRELSSEEDAYTWWSNRGRAWENNVGWRIDYQLLSPHLRGQVRSVDIYKEARFSDHAPCVITYHGSVDDYVTH